MYNTFHLASKVLSDNNQHLKIMVSQEAITRLYLLSHGFTGSNNKAVLSRSTVSSFIHKYDILQTKTLIDIFSYT